MICISPKQEEEVLPQTYTTQETSTTSITFPFALAEDVLTNDTYFGLLCEWFEPLEYINSFALLSKYHYDFIKKNNNRTIVQRVFCRQFGHRLNNLFFLKSSFAYSSISLFYMIWNDEIFTKHSLFEELHSNHIQYKLQHQILNRLQSESFMVRMHIFRPTLYILKYWFVQIAKSLGTELEFLGYDTSCNSFVVLPANNTSSNLDSDHEVWDQNTDDHTLILSSYNIDMSPIKIHFSAAILSVCMARVQSVFTPFFFKEFLRWIQVDSCINLRHSHFFEILWMSFEDENRHEWTPLLFEIVCDGFEAELESLKDSVSRLTIDTVRCNVNQILRLNLEWVLFNLHMFIAIHKNLCDDVSDNFNGDILFEKKYQKMKDLLEMNEQQQRIKDLSRRISPSLEGHRNLMERILILATTWPALSPNELQRSLRVYHLYQNLFDCS